MTNELSVNLYCVQMRSGIEIWFERERAERLQQVLEQLKQHMFVSFEDRTINTADIVGIFTANDMELVTRRKNGQWKCNEGTWHDKGEKCECLTDAQRENTRTWRDQYREKYGVDPAY